LKNLIDISFFKTKQKVIYVFVLNLNQSYHLFNHFNHKNRKGHTFLFMNCMVDCC